MTDTYIKTPLGRVAVDINAALSDPGEKALDAVRAAARNAMSRVFVKPGDAWAVTVTAGGEKFTLASGVATAKPGKMCALFTRLRVEADVAEPRAPEVLRELP